MFYYFILIYYFYRANEGIGEFMKADISQRMIVDMLFYLIVSIY